MKRNSLVQNVILVFILILGFILRKGTTEASQATSSRDKYVNDFDAFVTVRILVKKN